MSIQLVRPTIELKEQVLDFKQEHFLHNEMMINGSQMLDQIDSYEEWLTFVTNSTKLETVPPQRVVSDTFLAINENNRIVGIIDLRHELKGSLKDFGHCGYNVRPTERKKGYATQMLHLILEVAKEFGFNYIQLSAEKDNIASIKTIIKNGGKYERSFQFNDKEAYVYIIDL